MIAPRAQSGGPAPSGSWRQWARANPWLAIAVPGFCLAAVVGLVWSIPASIVSEDHTAKVDEGAPAETRAASQDDPAPPSPAAPATEVPRPEPAARPWTVESASARSPRGLSLVYGYRSLPPGGESRFEWFVRLEGLRSVVDGVEQVTWQMDPPAKNGADFVSRNRAGDGFPLLGDGPGGWFGVSATVRYKDGKDETLARRIELPE